MSNPYLGVYVDYYPKLVPPDKTKREGVYWQFIAV
jgi:hypothetical protein